MPKKNGGSRLSSDISRRDFVNGTLVGFGAALLGSAAPSLAQGKSRRVFSMIHGPALAEWAITPHPMETWLLSEMRHISSVTGLPKR